MHVLIPCCGESALPDGSRYSKSMREVGGKPMLRWVLDSYDAIPDKHVILIFLKEELSKTYSERMAGLLASEESAEVIYLDEPARGTLCTSLMAVDLIDDDEPLIIASCDQVVEMDVNLIIGSFATKDLDAGVVCVENDNSAWAYIRLDGDNVVEMAEENLVSNLAVAGFYYFKRGRDFVSAAERAVLKGSDHQGKFRISASVNELILKGGRVGYYQLEPAEVQTFESLERSRQQEERET